jgi:hypothetical protein
MKKLVAKNPVTGLYFNGRNFDGTVEEAMTLRPGTTAETFRFSWDCGVVVEEVEVTEKLTVEVRIYTTSIGRKYRYVKRSDGAEFQVVKAGLGLWVIESQKDFATTSATTLKAALCDIVNKQRNITGHARA